MGKGTPAVGWLGTPRGERGFGTYCTIRERLDKLRQTRRAAPGGILDRERRCGKGAGTQLSRAALQRMRGTPDGCAIDAGRRHRRNELAALADEQLNDRLRRLGANMLDQIVEHLRVNYRTHAGRNLLPVPTRFSRGR